ncbi:MAG: chromosome segregation protein SMC [Candidatus Hydrogenedentota bacterium]
MYFKNIEMTGFKSFADRTVVTLEPGSTAIVGPNGSGKSNILDAVRWVLGEQSAKALRGGHMQDVIFNGSENRAPTGMSEVTVTFDNADSRLPVDFAEVQISRRLYRSGESEYLLNKAPCRLRDVQELFMDTGIGTSAYSLIGQGKIDMVLSSKPEDRRYLFEEAAGIIKYKTRKRVAMRKLDNAEQNLVRLADIVQEVERQMRSLKRQVNAAMRHRELTAELRDLEIRNAWLKHRELTAVIETLKQAYEEAQKAYEKTSTETSELEANDEKLNLERIELERVLMARRDGVHQIDSEMEKIEGEIALIRQEITFGRQRQEEAEEERKELRARAANLVKEQGDIDSRATGIRGEIDSVQHEIDEKQAEHDRLHEAVQSADATLEALRARAAEFVNSRHRTQTEAENLGESIAKTDQQLEALYARQNDHGQRNEQVVADLQAAQKDESEQQAALTNTVEARKQEQEAHAEASRTLAERNDELQNLREQKSSTEARLTSLRELRDSYEGFAAGVRAIMMAKQHERPEAEGVIGPIGDLVSTDQEFGPAIEAALGGNINNIVVDQADAAKDAIAFLKKTRAGRVTFLPLDTIRVNRKDDTGALGGMPGIIGPAIDHVQYDPHITEAVKYLLWNTVIVRTIDDAIRIARSERRFPRLVTLDGEVVTSAGAVTGGATKHQSRGILGRSAEIEELEARVEQTDKRMRVLGDEIMKLGETIRAHAAQVRTLQETEEQHRAALNELGVRIARLSTELDSLQQSAKQLTEQRAALLEERAAMEKRRKEALARVDSMENDDEAIQQERSAAQEKVSQLREALSKCADALGDARVRLAGLTQNLEETERNRLREQREHEEALKEAGRRVTLIEEIKVREKELEDSIAQHTERAKALSETKEEAAGKVVEAQNKQTAIIEEAEAVGKKLKTLREQNAQAMKEVHRLDKELTHNEDQLAFHQERILEEYQVAVSQLTEEEVGEDEHDEASREKRIEECRKGLQRLGTVNLMAIEEYEALEQRYAFLTAQEEDLRKARETLLDVVERIDRTIKAMFLDTFDTVSENFKNFFRRLFNGGQARIYLLDEDDPLESGIEIEARPPGKKPQGISLLSGGEQALTAIALLFSIFAAKPSPFCVLDEVDAPLDDANIGRFLGLVQEFTNESQFIIITHNKQTMAAADAIYGVTQQERGVSEVVSVRFEDVAAVEEQPVG